MQGRSELIKDRKWSYVHNTQFTENLEEYVQRKVKNDFFAPNNPPVSGKLSPLT
jgi:hypothetical protein